MTISPPQTTQFITDEELNSWKKQGTKMGVFIGKRPYEKLPSEEGIRWISLDPEHEKIHKPNKKFDKPADQQSYHILTSFCKETATRLKGIFEKVVVDASTYKAFEGKDDTKDADTIANLKDLLDPEGEGVLIFDNSVSRQVRKMENFLLKLRSYLKDSEKVTDIQLLKYLRQGVFESDLSWDTYRGRLYTKRILESHFDDVQNCIYTPFPYPNRYNLSKFFIAKKVKKNEAVSHSVNSSGKSNKI